MSFIHRPLSVMYAFTILSSLICLQLAARASRDANDLNPTDPFARRLRPEAPYDTESIDKSLDDGDEADGYARRSTSFLRFGRQLPSGSGSFLRFGRRGQSGASFLRFGRRSQQHSTGSFLRFGRKGEFLRFG